MPVPVTMDEIVRSLERGTNAEKLQWRVGASPSQFLAPLGEYAVVIERSRETPKSRSSYLDDIATLRGDQVDVVRLRLMNSTGQEVDAFGLVDGDSDYKRLDELWERARVIAKGIGGDITRIREILRELARA